MNRRVAGVIKCRAKVRMIEDEKVGALFRERRWGPAATACAMGQGCMPRTSDAEAMGENNTSTNERMSGVPDAPPCGGSKIAA